MACVNISSIIKFKLFRAPSQHNYWTKKKLQCIWSLNYTVHFDMNWTFQGNDQCSCVIGVLISSHRYGNVHWKQWLHKRCLFLFIRWLVCNIFTSIKTMTFNWELSSADFLISSKYEIHTSLSTISNLKAVANYIAFSWLQLPVSQSLYFRTGSRLKTNWVKRDNERRNCLKMLIYI